MKWLALFLLLAGPAWADDDGAFGSPFRFTETSGTAVYAHVCAGCHMANGGGAQGAGTYPSLVADPRLAAAGYPIGVILHGQRAMPPFGRILSDQQVAEVVDYLRTHFGNSYAPAPTAAEVHGAR
jgi:mono/diheme cytochrome c family protein